MRFEEFAEFNAYLEEIDAGMRKDGVPIEARPLHALSIISMRHANMEFNISAAMALENKEIVEFEGDQLTRQIINWFDDRYGDRLKIGFWSGKSVTIVQGDPYLMKIPMVLGDVELTYDLDSIGQSGKAIKNGRTVVNIFDHIVDLTRETASRASKTEGPRLLNDLRANTHRLHRIRKMTDFQDSFDLSPDLDYAAQYIVDGYSNFGLARWHSLQAAEKALKSVLKCQGGRFPFTHDLYQLANASDMLGISPLALNAAMCSPSVRYEPDSSTLDQAINAYHASLEICFEVAKFIPKVGKPKSDPRPNWAKRLDQQPNPMLEGRD